MNTTSSNNKLLIGLVLFMTWVILIVFKVSGAEDLITTIKFALAGLGAYHLNDRKPPPPTGAIASDSALALPTAPTRSLPIIPQPSPEGGFANPFLLAFVTLAISGVLLLSGCASPQPVGTSGAAAKPLTLPIPLNQTPAQIAEQICPPLQAALTGLDMLVGLPPTVKADLDAITPIVAGVCAAGATVDVSSLQALSKTALPTLINVVKASGLAVEKQNSVILDIEAAQFVLSAIVQAKPVAAQAAPASTATSPVAK